MKLSNKVFRLLDLLIDSKLPRIVHKRSTDEIIDLLQRVNPSAEVNLAVKIKGDIVRYICLTELNHRFEGFMDVEKFSTLTPEMIKKLEDMK